MKKWTKILCFAVAGSAILATAIYVTANPETGVVYQSPYASLGIGLIGMGLCMESRKYQAAKSRKKQD